MNSEANLPSPGMTDEKPMMTNREILFMQKNFFMLQKENAMLRSQLSDISLGQIDHKLAAYEPPRPPGDNQGGTDAPAGTDTN